MIEWHITKECNLRCPFCYIDYSDSGEELTDSECMKLLEDLKQLGAPGIIFSGGEPLLRKKLILALVSRCKEYGMMSILATNGLALDQSLVEELVKAGISFVGLSLDGSKDIHNKLRGSDEAFDAVMRAIQMCNRFKILIQVQTCASKENFSEVPVVLGLCKELGVRKYLVLDFVPVGRGKQWADRSLSVEDREKLLDFVYAASVLLKGQIEVSYIEPYWFRKISQYDSARGDELRSRYLQGGVCTAGNSFFSILPNGDVIPCPRLQITAGNVRKETIQQIWSSSKVFHDLRSPKNLKGLCVNCSSKEICDGCRGRAYSSFGNYLQPDPFCIQNHLTSLGVKT